MSKTRAKCHKLIDDWELGQSEKMVDAQQAQQITRNIDDLMAHVIDEGLA